MRAPVKIMVIIGTRPEAIKLYPLIETLRADSRFAVVVCVSAQHRGMLDQVLAVTGIVPDHDLDLMRRAQRLDSLTAALLTGLGRVMDREHPARVIVQGDTATAMAGALAAHYRRIPVDHVEAGLRSGDSLHPWPEEANRKIIAALASLHFAPTPVAAAALRAENIDPARIHVTGNTGIDALCRMRERIAREPNLAAGLAELEQRFAGRRIIAVTAHRRESAGAGTAAVVAALRQIARRGDVGVIFPLHPEPRRRAAVERALGKEPAVALVEPLDYPHFVRLLGLSALVLTDSGGVQEEAPALGVPVLVLREATERREGLAAGTARLVGTDPAVIVAEVARLLDDPAARARMARAHSPFGDGAAARRIAALIAAESARAPRAKATVSPPA